MGDRGNVLIGGVYLYTHWGGSELAEDVQTALGRRERWNDTAYLARIIFCQMIPPEAYQSETGFGIGTERPDNEHLVIEVDCEEERVRFLPAPREGGAGDEGTPKHEWTFREYVNEWPEVIREKFNE